jgi:hypothetical protein
MPLINSWWYQRYLPTLCQNAPKFSPELWNFSPQVQKRYDCVTKRTRKSIKNRFCFQTGDTIVIYVSTSGHWDCTTLQHHCATICLDQYTLLNVYGASALQRQFVGRNIIPSDSEPLVYVINTWCCVLNAESTNSNFIDLDLTLPCSYISYLSVYTWAHHIHSTKCIGLEQGGHQYHHLMEI